MKRYTVRYERDEQGWWVTSVNGVAGCHTQGRTIAQARRRIREALGLFVEDADRANLVDEVKLGPLARRTMAKLRMAQRQAVARQVEAQRSAQEAARLLTKRLHLSVRDAGEILGLSHQRVQQLVHARSKAGRKKAS